MTRSTKNQAAHLAEAICELLAWQQNALALREERRVKAIRRAVAKRSALQRGADMTEPLEAPQKAVSGRKNVKWLTC